MPSMQISILHLGCETRPETVITHQWQQVGQPSLKRKCVSEELKSNQIKSYPTQLSTLCSQTSKSIKCAQSFYVIGAALVVAYIKVQASENNAEMRFFWCCTNTAKVALSPFVYTYIYFVWGLSHRH